MRRPRLAVVGYLSLDDIRHQGRVSEGVPGGGALYAGLAARRAGADVTIFASVGPDYPAAILRLLETVGIGISAIARRDHPTRRAGLSYGAGESRRDATIRDQAWRAATHALTPPEAPSGFDGYCVCPVSPEVLLNVRLAAGGAPLIADTSEFYAREMPEAVLDAIAGIPVFAPSLEEARLLLPGRSPRQLVSELAGRVPGLLLKRGRRGILAVANGQRRERRLPPVVARDATGAGDAAVGATAACLAGGAALFDALDVALTAGRDAVTELGALALLPEHLLSEASASAIFCTQAVSKEIRD